MITHSFGEYPIRLGSSRGVREEEECEDGNREGDDSIDDCDSK